jgi:hypothetical protein
LLSRHAQSYSSNNNCFTAHLDILTRRPARWEDWPMHDRERLLQHYVDPWAFLQRQAQAGRIGWPRRWEGHANVA